MTGRRRSGGPSFELECFGIGGVQLKEDLISRDVFVHLLGFGGCYFLFSSWFDR
jgi:hypothetical protein